MIRPTALGWKAVAFFAALLAAFFAAPYQNLYFLLLVFVATLGVLNVWWTVRNVSGVRGAIAPVAAFPAGASAVLRGSVAAGSRRRFDLRATLDLGPHGIVEARADMAGGADMAGIANRELAATAEIPPMPRGVIEVRGAWVESTYPLGLLRARRRIQCPRELVVHPAPAAMGSAAGGGAAALAAAIGAASGTDQPSGMRDFHEGDEVRAIHWRATARRGRPVVTQWDASAGDGLELVLDRRCPASALESALGLVTSLVLAARETKERITIHTQGLSKTFGPGHAPWDELLRALATADLLPPDAPPPPPAARDVLRLPVQRETVTA